MWTFSPALVRVLSSTGSFFDVRFFEFFQPACATPVWPKEGHTGLHLLKGSKRDATSEVHLSSPAFARLVRGMQYQGCKLDGANNKNRGMHTTMHPACEDADHHLHNVGRRCVILNLSDAVLGDGGGAVLCILHCRECCEHTLLNLNSGLNGRAAAGRCQ